jgi:serine/threonine protein kinase
VKTENMLLDKTRTVKIADFGVARHEAANPSDMTGETGTLGYMAPEVSFYRTVTGLAVFSYNLTFPHQKAPCIC